MKYRAPRHYRRSHVDRRRACVDDPHVGLYVGARSWSRISLTRRAAPAASVTRELVLLAIFLTGASSAVRAGDPLGLYVGAGIGRSEVRNNLDFIGFSTLHASDKTTGWKLMAGIRPISIIGVEAEFLDYGSANTTWSSPATQTQGGFSGAATSHPKAAALFAVGYLPIPLPYLDLFAKAGAAELRTDIRASGQATCPISLPLPPCFVIFVPPYSNSGSSTRFAFGAGAQVKLVNVALRAEYERISASVGDLDMLSLDLTLRF
jgi:opacity protein-like surface antigen